MAPASRYQSYCTLPRPENYDEQHYNAEINSVAQQVHLQYGNAGGAVNFAPNPASHPLPYMMQVRGSTFWQNIQVGISITTISELIFPNFKTTIHVCNENVLKHTQITDNVYLRKWRLMFLPCAVRIIDFCMKKFFVCVSFILEHCRPVSHTRHFPSPEIKKNTHDKFFHHLHMAVFFYQFLLLINCL